MIVTILPSTEGGVISKSAFDSLFVPIEKIITSCILLNLVIWTKTLNIKRKLNITGATFLTGKTENDTPFGIHCIIALLPTWSRIKTSTLFLSVMNKYDLWNEMSKGEIIKFGKF